MKEQTDSESESPHLWRATNIIKERNDSGSCIRTTPLSDEEQRMVMNLQAKYGNKWKKIASHLPGRSPKRLSKWFESVQEQHQQKKRRRSSQKTMGDSENRYEHILETIAEKFVQQRHITQISSHHFPSNGVFPSLLNMNMNIPPPPINSHPPLPPLGLNLAASIPTPDFANLPSVSSLPVAIPCLPPWMYNKVTHSEPPVNSQSSASKSASPSSPSVTLSLSPSPATEKAEVSHNYEKTDDEQGDLVHEASVFVQQCKDLEERQQSWLSLKKESSWRLKRLKQQLEAEKARKRKEKMDEIEGKVKALREEERHYLERLETDYRDQIARIQRDADAKEARLMEMWTAKHHQISKSLDQIIHHHSRTTSLHS